MNAPVNAVLFDLDGTLLDTAPDMGGALNRLLAEHGRSALAAEAIRPHVSHGTRALLALAFDVDRDRDRDAYEPLAERFLDLYRASLADATRPFQGVPATLAELSKRGIAWGIVTNKPGWLTEPLLDQLRLQPPPGCVVSGDTVGVAKPHPEPLLYACRQLGVDAALSVYVGDAERDIEAARRAQMPGLIAGYGYIGAGDSPNSWGAAATLDRPQDLLPWLDEQTAGQVPA